MLLILINLVSQRSIKGLFYQNKQLKELSFFLILG